MGPLAGIRIIEMAGIGPAPFAAMMLSDLGAEVIRIDRKGRPETNAFDVIKSGGFLNRGRRSIALDLKKAQAVSALFDLIASADALLEGFRPGVMERLGLGPQACLARNPGLVYGRITGWGQNGPLAHTAGHDINYIALTGALHAIGKAEAPVPPLNMVGDFGGGAMFVAFGMVCALLEARTSGQGQVVDAAMTDGAALLMAMQYSFKSMGHWQNTRESNLLDGGAPFYGTYKCADGKWLAVGAIEPRFHDVLIDKLGLSPEAFAGRWNPEQWPHLRQLLADTILTRTRSEWCAVFEGTDACVAPVLDMDEAPLHPHNLARQTFVSHAEVMQPAPAPRFSRTLAQIQRPPAVPGEHSEEILRDWGFCSDRIDSLKACGAL
ncbi:MAG: CoA transferase [Propionivibrio sp.]|uniref:CaiB/BaiF CoA transferase family protein n=1 Tax=Propionivibrio sp. TaxID=2212460 RepID=UPI001A4650B5|nr:CaiB/BaiF CoA-transferase family protein [Propionivibrio sp.]MBL8415209.1 CoA transferase [Propionivibrio sp.]